MHLNSSRTRTMAAAVALISLLALLLVERPAVSAAPAVPRILVLNSYNIGYDWSDHEMEGVRTTLETRFKRVDLLVEHLDTKKFYDKRHFPQLATLFQAKYRDTHFDVVIAMDNAALEFATVHRSRLFPEVPLVFCGVNDYSPKLLAGQKKVTGVAELHDSAGTVALALKLHPATSRIVVVGDNTDTGIAMKRELEKRLAAGERAKLHFMKEMPLEDLVEALQQLPPDNLVLMTSYTVEKSGRSFSKGEVSRIVTAASPVPVYAVFAAQLGYGIVGGRLIEGRSQGEKAAELAIRVMDGDDPDAIGVFTESLSRPMFDYKLLQKFKIPVQDLPAGSLVINRPVSSYAVQKTTFWAGALFTLTITASLVVLYINNERRKRLEKVLRQSEARFKQLFDSAGDAIYIHDADCRIVEANQAACDRMGYSREEILRLTLQEINPPEQREGIPERVSLVMRHGRLLFESAHLTRSGELLPVEVSSRVIEYGDRPAILSIVRDISQRKRVELREKTRLKILEELATGASLVSLLTYIVRFVEQECSGALCSVLLANEAGTRLQHGAAPSLPDFYNEAVDGLKVKMGMGSCGTAAFQRKRVIIDDIENHPYWNGFTPAREAGLKACWSEPVLSADGALLGTFAIYFREQRSPSNEELALIESAAHMASIAIGRVRSEESRANLEEQMRQMQKIEAIGQLAGGLAHDFNNLLTPIIVYADIILRTLKADDGNVKKVNLILASAQKAADLTKKLLSFGRKQILTMETLDLNEVIVSLLDLMQRTIRGNIEIETHLSPLGAHIYADRVQVEQILINFAVNAQDAISGKGKIRIETGTVVLDNEFAEAHPGMRTGQHILLSFTDNGCGMTDEVVRHIFEPFYTTKPVGHGTGLGLATVYGIVKQHNGYIKVVTKAGHGSSFLVYLPKAAPEKRAWQSPSARLEVGSCANQTILVVDDNEMVREMAVELLQSSGYRVLAAGSPVKAQEIMDAHGSSVNLLVTDVVMPEMSGPELYERITERYPDLPVLYISGYTSDIQVRHRAENEEVNFLPKPFTCEQMLHTVQRALKSV